jgi:hypothetical protein
MLPAEGKAKWQKISVAAYESRTWKTWLTLFSQLSRISTHHRQIATSLHQTPLLFLTPEYALGYFNKSQPRLVPRLAK